MFRVEARHARDWTSEQLDALFAEGFPAFITADQEVKKHIRRVRELFGDLDIMLVGEDAEPVATGWGVPVSWSGEGGELPTSFADCLRRAVELHDVAGRADTFVICGGVVHPARKGTGAAQDLVRALCATAESAGLTRVIAPLRPTPKHLYPLFDIDAYATWVRADGLPFDPWLRLHVRLGGQVVGLLPNAQTMTGTVAQWEKWTGLALPASGLYVIPGGMAPLQVDLLADLGRYVEPNIWVRHR